MKSFAMIVVLLFSGSVFANPGLDVSGIDVQGLSAKNENGILVIEGDAINKNPQMVKEVFISINLYKDKKNVGDTMVRGSHLEPMQTWHFKVGTQVPFDSYKVSEINVFN